MFKTLIASDGKSRRRTVTPGTVLLSILLHGVVLVGAVYATVSTPAAEPPAEEDVTFLMVDEPEPPPPPDMVSEPAPPEFRDLVPPLEPPPFIPDVDLSQPRVKLEDFSGVGPLLPSAPPAMTPVPQPLAGDTMVFEPAVLDRPPRLENVATVISAMQRSYPRILLDAGISGQVVARFVVLPDGSVDMSSVRILSATNDRFEGASIEVIDRFQFNPGVYRGQPVRVLIELPISWQADTR